MKKQAGRDRGRATGAGDLEAVPLAAEDGDYRVAVSVGLWHVVCTTQCPLFMQDFPMTFLAGSWTWRGP